jgi:hypothetical protein
MEKVRALATTYDLCNVLNMDETGLFGSLLLIVRLPQCLEVEERRVRIELHLLLHALLLGRSFSLGLLVNQRIHVASKYQ